MQQITTAKINKNKAQNNISKDIEASFKIINAYLPNNYATTIALKLNKKASTVRAVKNRNHIDVKIIKELEKLALETKNILNP